MAKRAHERTTVPPGPLSALPRGYQNLRGITRTIHSLQRRLRLPHPAKDEQLNIQRIGSALAAMNSERITSVLVGAIHTPGEVLLLSAGLLEALESQGDLQS